MFTYFYFCVLMMNMCIILQKYFMQTQNTNSSCAVVRVFLLTNCLHFGIISFLSSPQQHVVDG